MYNISLIIILLYIIPATKLILLLLLLSPCVFYCISQYVILPITPLCKYVYNIVSNDLVYSKRIKIKLLGLSTVTRTKYCSIL